MTKVRHTTFNLHLTSFCRLDGHVFQNSRLHSFKLCIVHKNTVHFGYKGHFGPVPCVPHIRLALVSEGLSKGCSVWNIIKRKRVITESGINYSDYTYFNIFNIGIGYYMYIYWINADVNGHEIKSKRELE